ncbi:MAG: GIY-YIG nuclease family protein [Candidatus Thiodiazotropha sp. (ex Notomyrtea botanica)]|nr:GIY-YIG nuclease family protein [Candidatus Thiodiazotropha sp. (ex Notomyrtea botanica)]
MTDGYIYLLINQSIPGMVKIGYTSATVESRINQLNSTGVPTPFQLAAQFYVRDVKTVEAMIHKKLNPHRVNDRREFFSGTVSELLNSCFSIITNALVESYSVESVQTESGVHGLTKTEKHVLLALVDRREHGYHIYDLQRYEVLNHNPLVLERELEKLREHGFVQLRRARKDMDFDLWRITSKGIKILFDVGALLED